MQASANEGINTGREKAAAEWRSHWTLVATGMMGMSFSVIAINAIGLFMAPLQSTFGWSRAEVTSGLTIFALVAVPLSPVVGGLIDRWGARRLAIPGVLLTSLAFASFSLVEHSLAQWWALWVVYSLVALAVKTTVWTSAVSNTFEASRGLALAVTLSGSAVGAFAVPLCARWLMDQCDWRTAFVAMGIGWGLLTLFLVLAFFREPGGAQLRTQSPYRGPPPAPLAGLDFSVAIRSGAFVRIAASVLLNTTLLVAVVVHMVPMLTDSGMTRAQAAAIASLFGIAALVGKILCGWLLDRVPGRPIAIFALALPAAPSLIFLMDTAQPALYLIAVVLFGLASGGQVQASTYLVTRYVGMRNYGKIYGVLTSLVAFATGTGPLVAGMIYDAAGSYWPIFAAGILISAICGFLMSQLGPYPDHEVGQRIP
jgi:MFS family permease